jgi:hypothetical protein
VSPLPAGASSAATATAAAAVVAAAAATAAVPGESRVPPVRAEGMAYGAWSLPPGGSAAADARAQRNGGVRGRAGGGVGRERRSERCRPLQGGRAARRDATRW